ncbi:hypothetical protein D0869_06219 [Hortaea werneckii]|uniref:Uncharacterized protein n=1 Tax=Hortaea werneckii TaxID=91943 RepID=A0A3M6ZAB0_HORWE|nr:APG6-domain-containing protein [Hortaea werneckii]KAI7580659.1 APG6-domain-containing protein [Hortaea werneckii]RMX82218.1 hypothetical protein D0869_06219 [Hortaea werneckii]RMY12039.1 hypothetical protein D0868_02799 [Hortaea werneckii]RMY71844.1 hypothetical protein D0863_04897 [Hortaea werneckii]
MATLICQKCRTPLSPDSSLEHLNPASFKILAEAAPALEPRAPDEPRSAAAKDRKNQYDEASSQAGSPLQRRNLSASQKPSGKAHAPPDMSYIDVTESLISPEGPGEVVHPSAKPRSGSSKKSSEDSGSIKRKNEPFSKQLETTTRLFEILSSRSDIDHPVCTECTDLLLSGLQNRQQGVVRERDAYVDFLKRAQQDVPTDDDKAVTKRDLERAREREQKALEELEALEAEKARMEAEIAELDVESEALDSEEASFWQDRNAFLTELNAFQEERDSLQTQLAHDSKLLDTLQRTNVYNDTFTIGHDGVFGTINGLRLGRLADHPVEWSEINAALGQALLLLAVVSEKLGCKIRGYRLVPMGSTSKIVLEEPEAVTTGAGKSKGTVHELYSSGNLPFGLGAFYGGFDTAMIAFLECLRQVGEHVERKSATSSDGTGGNSPANSPRPGMKMPYEITTSKDGGRIGGLKVHLGGVGKETEWTKACKYLLTCCKFLLAHASHVGSHGGQYDKREQK